MAITTLNDVFDEWTTNGIFKTLADNHTLPWSDVADANDLDLDYHGNYSGDKPVSPLVLKLMNVYESDDALKVALSDVLYTKYNLTWSRLWDAINEEYDPLHNYDGTETVTETRNLSTIGSASASINNIHTDTGTITDNGSTTNDVTHTSTGTISDSGTTSSDATHTNTGTVSHPVESNTTTTGQSNIYGFNSSNEVPSDSSSGSSSSSVTSDVVTNNLTETDDVDGTSTNTRTNNLTDVDDAESTNTNTRTNNLTLTDNGTETSSTSTADTGTVTTTTTKGGNLGVTTSEQMLTQEFEFRAKYNFFETVYKDIDKVLCLAIY